MSLKCWTDVKVSPGIGIKIVPEIPGIIAVLYKYFVLCKELEFTVYSSLVSIGSTDTEYTDSHLLNAINSFSTLNSAKYQRRKVF